MLKEQLKRKLRNYTILSLLFTAGLLFAATEQVNIFAFFGLVVVDIISMIRIYQVNKTLEREFGYYWGSK
jgi:ethanolamine transporter EutH